MNTDKKHPTTGENQDSPKGNQAATKGNKDARQPDPETLGTSDPQNHMKGPISSLVQKTREKVDENDDETPEDAGKK
jgi:hypothetical protein